MCSERAQAQGWEIRAREGLGAGDQIASSRSQTTPDFLGCEAQSRKGRLHGMQAGEPGHTVLKEEWPVTVGFFGDDWKMRRKWLLTPPLAESYHKLLRPGA